MKERTRINLKVKIIGAGLTIQDLSYKIKNSTQVIYRIIRGESEPTLEFISALSNALNVPIWELFPENFDNTGIGIVETKTSDLEDELDARLDGQKL